QGRPASAHPSPRRRRPQDRGDPLPIECFGCDAPRPPFPGGANSRTAAASGTSEELRDAHAVRSMSAAFGGLSGHGDSVRVADGGRGGLLDPGRSHLEATLPHVVSRPTPSATAPTARLTAPA